MKSQALKGHLDLLLLAILAEGPTHGYAVIEALDVRSDGEFDLPEGTVYPALHRLEKAGLLGSEWSVVGGRRRRTYSISAKGRAALTEQASAWDQFSSAVTRVLGGGTANGEPSWA
jgi:PadR family transcriptional regulator PadR